MINDKNVIPVNPRDLVYTNDPRFITQDRDHAHKYSLNIMDIIRFIVFATESIKGRNDFAFVPYGNTLHLGMLKIVTPATADLYSTNISTKNIPAELITYRINETLPTTRGSDPGTGYTERAKVLQEQGIDHNVPYAKYVRSREHQVIFTTFAKSELRAWELSEWFYHYMEDLEKSLKVLGADRVMWLGTHLPRDFNYVEPYASSHDLVYLFRTEYTKTKELHILDKLDIDAYLTEIGATKEEMKQEIKDSLRAIQELNKNQ